MHSVVRYCVEVSEMNESVPTIKIIVATHKKYQMPDDSMYLPVQVGAEGKSDLGYTRDNTGENISSKNPSFCELTGLYWAWKNLNADYIGLVHYRRHFGKKKKEPLKGVLSGQQLYPLLGKYKIFVPKKRRYFIETLYSHYKHTHYAEQLDETRKIIEHKYPEYLSSYQRVTKHTYGYMFNMMIMERQYFDEYCTWLFDILFELEKRIKTPELSAFQGRFYGRVSEIIFNVWLDEMLKSGKLRRKDIKELQYFHVEKINWFKKGGAFLKAKFVHEKYEGSF